MGGGGGGEREGSAQRLLGAQGSAFLLALCFNYCSLILGDAGNVQGGHAHLNGCIEAEEFVNHAVQIVLWCLH